MVRVITILLVIVSGILCSGAQQGVSSTQAGQTLQIQPNVRKYNKHTATEKPCTTAGSTSGTRKDKPGDNSDLQDYVPIGGPAPGTGYPYPYPAYPYPYQPAPGSLVLVPSGSPYRPAPQYPYEPQYPVDGAQPPPAPYYPPYYPATPSPPPPYPALPYPPPPPPPAYPAPQTLYEQATVIEAYRSPQQLPPYLQQQPTAEQSQFFRQPVTAGQYYQSGPPPLHFRAHAHNRPMPTAAPPAFLQQRDASPTATSVPATAAANSNAETQYEQQQSGPFDGNQFHY